MKTLAEILPTGKYNVNLYEFFSYLMDKKDEIELHRELMYSEFIYKAIESQFEYKALSEDDQMCYFNENAYEIIKQIIATKGNGTLNEVELVALNDNLYIWRIKKLNNIDLVYHLAFYSESKKVKFFNCIYEFNEDKLDQIAYDDAFNEFTQQIDIHEGIFNIAIKNLGYSFEDLINYNSVRKAINNLIDNKEWLLKQYNEIMSELID